MSLWFVLLCSVSELKVFSIFGAYSWVHFFDMSCPWPKAAFNENSRCRAFTVAASGLLWDYCSGSVCVSGLILVLRTIHGERKERWWRRSAKDYLDSAIFTRRRDYSTLLSPSLSFSVCLFSLQPSNSLHLHPKSSHLDYPYRSERDGVEMGSFHVSHSLSLPPPLPPNLPHVHDTNTETDISSPASLHDIYHCAS